MYLDLHLVWLFGNLCEKLVSYQWASRIIKSGKGIGLRLDKWTCTMPGKRGHKLQNSTGVLTMWKDHGSSVLGISKRCSSGTNWSRTGPGNKHPISVRSNSSIWVLADESTAYLVYRKEIFSRHVLGWCLGCWKSMVNVWRILATMYQTQICTNKDAAVYRAASLGMNAEIHQAFGFVHRSPTGYHEKRISKGRV